MQLDWQVVPKLPDGSHDHTSKHWPYLWCHMCNKIKYEALRITPNQETRNGLLEKGNFGICLSCLDDINSYMREVACAF